VYHLQILTCTASVTSLILVQYLFWCLETYGVFLFIQWLCISYVSSFEFISALAITLYVCLRLLAQSPVMFGQVKLSLTHSDAAKSTPICVTQKYSHTA
jgi:hypothetical protein